MSNPITEVDLSSDQREVYQQMKRWTEAGTTRLVRTAREAVGGDSSILTVGGYAGTGKSTLLSVFAKSTDLLCAYVTYTGRASSVLRTKFDSMGVMTTRQLRRTDEDAEEGGDSFFDGSLGEHSGPPLCTTIHSLLYRPVIDEKTGELLGFSKRKKLDRRYDLIIVDEASMVGDEMLLDIQQHGVPIMAVGDHGQLPPVMASGKLMQRPKLRLEKIHRQAEGSPIIMLAKHIREGGSLRDFDLSAYEPGIVRFRPRTAVSVALVEAYASEPTELDVGVLCWTNKSRVRLNGTAREVLTRRGVPQHGEVVICLKNVPPAYNGMRGVLTEDATMDLQEPWIMHSRIEFPQESIPSDEYRLCASQFNREKTFSTVAELHECGIEAKHMANAGLLFDFGYAMTAHKSQGSQFNHALVYLDRPERPDEEDYRRWTYTAVTRAAKKLTVLR